MCVSNFHCVSLCCFDFADNYGVSFISPFSHYLRHSIYGIFDWIADLSLLQKLEISPQKTTDVNFRYVSCKISDRNIKIISFFL